MLHDLRLFSLQSSYNLQFCILPDYEVHRPPAPTPPAPSLAAQGKKNAFMDKVRRPANVGSGLQHPAGSGLSLWLHNCPLWVKISELASELVPGCR